MGKGKDLSDSVRIQIVEARGLGRSLSEIARLVGCSRSSVARVCRLGPEEMVSSRRHGCGRPSLIDKRGMRRLTRLVQNNSAATVAQVTQNFNDGRGRKVSEHTVHRALLRLGLRSRRPVTVPPPAPGHCQKRLHWARDHQMWTLELWKKVTWSGVSNYALSCTKGQFSVRRLCAQDVPPAGTVERRKADEGRVTLWSIFSWDTLGACIRVDDGLSPSSYLRIVADHVHTFMSAVFPDGGGVFQQDFTPCPSVREWFEEHEDEFRLLAWPPNSSDLNPISHLWDELELQFRSSDAAPQSLDELKDMLVSSWYKIPQTVVRGAVESMVGKVAAVVAAGTGLSGQCTASTQTVKEALKSQAEWLADYALGLCEGGDYEGESYPQTAEDSCKDQASTELLIQSIP